jgi:hypothetical protein
LALIFVYLSPPGITRFIQSGFRLRSCEFIMCTPTNQVAKVSGMAANSCHTQSLCSARAVVGRAGVLLPCVPTGR